MWGYNKTRGGCQRTSFVPKYSSRLKALLARLFNILSTDFSRSLLKTNRGMRFLLFGAEQLTCWPVAHPSSSATASEVTAFIEQHTTHSFGMPRLVISDIGPCFTASSSESFLIKYSFEWKTVVAYALTSNGRAERRIRTIRAAIGKIVHCKPSDWDFAVPRVRNGYRHQSLVSGLSFFQKYMECHPGCQLNNYGGMMRTELQLKGELRKSLLWLRIALRIVIRLIRRSVETVL